MEGKGAKSPLSSVIMVVLMLGLFLAQTQVAAKSCCVNTTARNCYNTCRLTGTSQATCANLCGCIHITGTKCPASHPKLHFCKLGCESSMCSTLSTNSDVGEELVQPCINKCSDLCNEGASDEVVFTA